MVIIAMAKTTSKFTVEGMTCGHCAETVRRALAGLEGESTADVRLEEKNATVTFDPEHASPEQMAEAVKNAGYALVILGGAENTAEHESGRSSKPAQSGVETNLQLVDPVCGMNAKSGSQHKFTHNGAEYYFCSAGCREKFASDPEKYLKKKVDSKNALTDNGGKSVETAGEAGGAATHTDPVCGMQAKPDSPHKHTYKGKDYFFCSAGCLKKFSGNPENYLSGAPRSEMSEMDKSPAATPGSKYTCPMHPEVVKDGPGSCPKCGMALEPMLVSADEEENPELAAMRKSLLFSAVVTVPVVVFSM